MDYRFADRMATIQPSAIRQILKVTEQPEMISFAGGLPAPEYFPVAEIAASAQRVLTEHGQQALQYSVTEGLTPLREKLVAEMASRGVGSALENILITTGSQQALDLIAKVALNPGDCVLTESPTYLAALQVFQFFGARFATAPMDEHGLVTDALEEIILRERPKVLYTIPNFQNPSGITMAIERREKIIEIAQRHNLLIIEDDPYGKLRYRGENIPPLKSLDRDGNVVYLSTFSKTVSPGLRTGWIVAADPVIKKITIAKQAADLHTSTLDQRIIDQYLTDFDNAAHIQRIREVYGARYAVMNSSLEKSMPEGFTWTRPEGGMFLWVTCPEPVDTQEMMRKAIEKKVLFVPGKDFFADGSGRNFLRLNFSNAKENEIRSGIERLAEVARVAAIEKPALV